MRPGPSEDLLAQGSVIGVRISVMHGSQVLATDVPVKDVTVEVTGDRAVPELLTYTAPREWIPVNPQDALNCFGQRSHVTVIQQIDGQPYEIKVGWFTHGSRETRSWEETADGVKVTAFGLLQVAADNDFAHPSSPPHGASLRSELSRLSGLPVMLDGLTDRPVPRTLQWGTSRLDGLADLAESYGLDYAVKPDGYVHVWPIRDGHAPVARYPATVLDAPRSGMPRRANVFVGVGSGEGDKRWTHTARVFQPPYSPETYGLITERIELSSASSDQAVMAAVQERVRALNITNMTRSIEIVPDWRLELGDIVQAVTPAGEHITGRVKAFSATVRAGETMRVDLEELLW